MKVLKNSKVEGCPLCWPGSEGDLLTQNYVLTEWPGVMFYKHSRVFRGAQLGGLTFNISFPLSCTDTGTGFDRLQC